MPLVSILAASAAQTIPIMFFSVALPVLMREADVSLTLIGLTGLIFLPQALSFLWAPFVDETTPNRLGRRRGWLVAMQIAMAALATLCIFFPPDGQILVLLALALAIAFMATSERTAILGFAVETTTRDNRPWAGAMLPAGGALGALMGASGLLFLFGRMGWAWTMGAIAILLLVLIVPILASREPAATRTATARPSVLRFLRRRDIRPILAFVAPLALGLGLGFGMMQPRLVDLGFTLAQIGLINGVFTCLALFTAGPLAAFLIARSGLTVMLPVGLAGIVLVLGFAAITSTAEFSAFYAAFAVVLFYFTFGFLGVMTNTIFMNASAEGQEGTDFTIFICFYWLMSLIGIVSSGLIAERFGYGATFAAGASVAALAALGLRRVSRQQEAQPEATPA